EVGYGAGVGRQQLGLGRQLDAGRLAIPDSRHEQERAAGGVVSDLPLDRATRVVPDRHDFAVTTAGCRRSAEQATGAGQEEPVVARPEDVERLAERDRQPRRQPPRSLLPMSLFGVPVALVSIDPERPSGSLLLLPGHGVSGIGPTGHVGQQELADLQSVHWQVVTMHLGTELTTRPSGTRP